MHTIYNVCNPTTLFDAEAECIPAVTAVISSHDGGLFRRVKTGHETCQSVVAIQNPPLDTMSDSTRIGSCLTARTTRRRLRVASAANKSVCPWPGVLNSYNR